MESASPPVPVANDYQNTQEGIWPNGPVQLARGRQAKDPNAKTIAYQVTSIEDFESSLRDYLNQPQDAPEHTECQFTFWIGATFLVQAPQPAANAGASQPQAQAVPPQQHSSQPPPPGYQPAGQVANGVGQYGGSHNYQSVSDPAMALTMPNFPSNDASMANNNKTKGAKGQANAKDKGPKITMSIMQALQPTTDPKEKMRNQRAIAKCCIDTIQRIDGYRYSFHNCWNSREDDSFRFSYYCNDSLLNKDRAANGKGAKLGKRATKPVYDCKGVLSVKFSATKSSLDVHYKHVPVHKTYEERAPPPRKDSKRRKFLEQADPDALVRLSNRPRTAKSGEESEPDPAPKPKKRKNRNSAAAVPLAAPPVKSTEEPKTAANSIESDLRAQSLRSLLELIQTDPDPPPPPPPPPAPVASAMPVPVPEPPRPGPAAARKDDKSKQAKQPKQQTQSTPQQNKKRPRNSCDVCKAKKTKVSSTWQISTSLKSTNYTIYSIYGGLLTY
ncbi:hypothetical protein BU24DRAFT_339448 [Aaosphaeria arxii CBS 175.79]|uniref:Uncharacterized protein n=1 Tax=Aaosphaeria arxii CBS 175.79 TaxID=1450172 RepID=A0A6A5YA78_9PLEO|nr:uncharacterized protein BU24DRAFT_339448 [Aaosphaeria arxii CBS 175.79]KAF2022126.1 hypothetical protein BU24DRAFT_339448 [Aaosphaeria arxii CBS 175.79]